MKNQRKITSFVIRVWQEPSQLQPPGEWRISVRPLAGGVETLLKSAADLWRYLTGEEISQHSIDSSNPLKVKGESQHEQ